MIYEFSFHIKIGDYCILHTPIEYPYYDYPNTYKVIIPENSVLRVDKLNIKTDSTNPNDEIEFYFLGKKNKHIITDYKVPGLISISIYKLNGIKYSLVKEENIEVTINSLLRKYKIEKIKNII